MNNTVKSPWQTVCKLSELPPGLFLEFRIHQPDRDPDTIPLTGFAFLQDGNPAAYVNQCPHLGVELNWMPGRFMDTDNLFIQCSTHGALFKPGTGECITGPCQGEYLTALDVRVEEGQVQIRFPD
ncbi:Rieske (2Fe-2S) protein [Marinobacter salinisoli]|uniref:Rieske (2Fe-2S) protein n=1 Tax=Marinobacter salinisoli TaxID=2769486 RepID=A0ABX7MUW4_9GAMM|nr:Rieske (2Fe-2S) protein [Marinobacter salinisoli]QSP95959.1 Rieske (2Fe-2S) protein [Marinobacter salinisoli]